MSITLKKSKLSKPIDRDCPFIGPLEPSVDDKTTHILPLVRINRPFVSKRKISGFTLIELMVTVVIIGILAAIAYPSYMNYGIKTNRSAAQSFMLEVAAKEEQYLLDARSYTATLGSGGLNLTAPDKVATKYNVTIDSVTSSPLAYRVVATPIAGTSQANDGTLYLTQAGAKSPAGKW